MLKFRRNVKAKDSAVQFGVAHEKTCTILIVIPELVNII